MPINRYSSSLGFSLIEMLIVVALIAILAGIAMPAYNGYINRSEIRTAQSDLTALSLNFENRYSRMMAYPASAGGFDQSELEQTFTAWRPASERFTFTATSDGATYTVTATGATGGVDGCVLTLARNGDREIKTCSYSSDGNWL